jgi:acetyl esterase/lipase
MKPVLASFVGLFLAASIAQAAPPKLPDGVEAKFDIEYARPDDKPQLLDVYWPKDAQGKLPVIIDIHGGGWTGGSKRPAYATRFVKDGYAVVSVEYRFSQVAPFPAQIDDCKAAVRWTRAHAAEFHLDPDHIGAWGDSAGGHLVALLGTSADSKELEGEEGNPGISSRVQAVCDCYGPADFLTFQSQQNPDVKVPADDARSALSKLLGGPIPQKKELAAQASPVTYVSKDSAPFLILQGDKDPLVPPAQSQELYERLQKSGVEAELFIVKGGGHGFGRRPDLDVKTREFFDKHLKSQNATGK